MPEEQALIVLTCRCGQKMKAPAKAKGKVFKCVRCGELVRVAESHADVPSPPVQNGDPPRVAEALEPVGQLLVKAELITAEQLQHTLQTQREKGGKFLETLLALGHLSKEALHEFLSKQPGIAAIDLSRLQLDRSLVELIPKQTVLDNLVLPIDRLGKLLTVAMACPLDITTIREIERITGLRVKAVLCKLDDIHKAVRKYYPSDDGSTQEMTVFELPPSMALRKAAPAAAPLKEDLSEKIAHLDTLGVGENTLITIDELANDSQATLDDFGAIAASDPLLAAILLQTSNTAAYGVAGQVDNLWSAVALIGAAGFIQIAKSCGASGAYAGLHIEPVVTRARRCAAFASALAQAYGKVGTGQAYTAGLLHELGCFALAYVAKEKYAKVDLKLYGQALQAAERQHFTLSHTEAGERIATRWRFPNALCQVFGAYLNPDSANGSKELASIVNIASIAAGDPSAIGGKLAETCSQALKCLNLSTPDVIGALQRSTGTP